MPLEELRQLKTQVSTKKSEKHVQKQCIKNIFQLANTRVVYRYQPRAEGNTHGVGMLIISQQPNIISMPDKMLSK